MQFPLISVVTVVYNDIAHIVETMDSVVGQDYPHIEYIIIDGASSDGTREKIMEYIISNAVIDSKKCEEQNGRIYLTATHREKNLRFKFLSEADSGIYDAMNKGIDLATGEWCNFMNCGDRFYNSHTILELFTRFFVMHGGGAAHHNFATFIIYGDTQIIYDDTHSKILYASTKPHKYHHNFIHQSSFIATPLMQKYRYDTGFKIAGDSDFFAKAYNNGANFIYIPLTVSSFNVEGISSSLSWQMFKEDCQIGYKYNCLFPIFHALKYMFWVIPRVCIRNAIPANFRNQARILLGKKTN
ncbi:glycosyltransferase family 2 protein [Helicobacter cinaedi]|uniref:Glycosyltransferase family protein n=1 Tax=Helicobacter cinaedi TaxID=213 RepID=A0A377JMJ4_9HELI|nr:glycosyltransferase family 2 protein [Helicobacter cinaedi]STP08907.1 glycosyltransferase family protein [Helicobacter cinaedi]